MAQKYIPLTLNEMVFEQPADRLNLAILRDIYNKEFPYFTKVFNILKEKGIDGLVIDLSSVPDKEKLEFMSVLLGVSLSEKMNVRYVGIKKEEVEKGNWDRYREYALSTVKDDFDSAVESFSLLQ